ALRRWRLATPATNHEAIRAKLQSAGIGLFAYRVDYDDQFTEEEIEVTFQQAKALGVRTMPSLPTQSGARRLAPFAEKHAITVEQFPIPVFVEYEYLGLGTPQDEVRKCMAYVKAALA